MARGRATPPSYHQGYARRAGESAYPGMWKGLIGAWEPALGVTGITTLRDVSGFGNGGTFEGSMTAADWVIGGNSRMPGYAISYDGSDDRIDMGTPGRLNDQSPFTLITWMNEAANPVLVGHLVAKRSAGVADGQWYLRTTSDQSIQFIVDIDGDDVARRTSASTYTQNVWHHVVLTWDGSLTAANVHIYIDGIEPGYQTTTNGIGPVVSDASENFVIGGRGDGNSSFSFNGMIGETRFYGDRVFNPAEAWLNYQISLAPFILRSMVFVKAPAAAPGLSIPVAMHQYFRQHSAPWM